MSTANVAQEFTERVSVFTGGFTLEAAQVVCADATVHQDEMPSLVSLLVERELIELEGPSVGSRYRLVPELRSKLYACLMAREQVITFQLRLGEYLYDLAKQGLGHLTNGGLGSYGYEWSIPIGPEGKAWFDRLCGAMERNEHRRAVRRTRCRPPWRPGFGWGVISSREPAI